MDHMKVPEPMSEDHPSAQLAPLVQPVGDQVVQGSVVAGKVGAPPDAMEVESNHRALHEGTRANVWGPHNKSGAHLGAQLVLPVGSVGEARPSASRQCCCW